MREVQAALNTLGYGPLDVDGINGPNTKRAVVSFQRAAGLTLDGIVGPMTTNALKYALSAEPGKPSKIGTMHRIIWHWTAGADGISQTEDDHYHDIIERNGNVVAGDFPIEANIPPLIPGRYAAHTRNANSYSIGISLDAMSGARERPFTTGRYPITETQIDALVRLTARRAAEYGIPVTRQTILSHAEVQTTLGIKQSGKWDISWIPGMDKPGDPVQVGVELRMRVARLI